MAVQDHWTPDYEQVAADTTPRSPIRRLLAARRVSCERTTLPAGPPCVARTDESSLVCPVWTRGMHTEPIEFWYIS
nr:hypothetical protein ICEMyc226_00066 [Mycolicibacterium sp.]